LRNELLRVYQSDFISPPFPTRRCTAPHACPCSFFGDPIKPCTCSPGIVTKYQKRIAGPLHDRIDIHFEVPRGEYEKLSDQRLGESSSVIQKRVEAARQCLSFSVGVD
jgi:predicted ATPase with chaperone activity